MFNVNQWVLIVISMNYIWELCYMIYFTTTTNLLHTCVWSQHHRYLDNKMTLQVSQSAMTDWHLVITHDTRPSDYTCIVQLGKGTHASSVGMQMHMHSQKYIEYRLHLDNQYSI